jgi:hypothetical protein
MDPAGASFFDSLEQFDAFEGVTDAANYRPLPDGWLLATADIVNSTGAIRSGLYKSVNMAGASVISALLNTVGRRDLPFVFGGDGAIVALPPADRAKATEALGAIQLWVRENLSLSIRAAIVPLEDIRAAGLDVRVARFRASEQVSYAMFTGGGSSWAEAQMKAGRFLVPPAPAGTEPDLTGLSCRWNPIDARNGEIVSIIAIPTDGGDAAKFRQLVAAIVSEVGDARGGHPVPLEGPETAFSSSGVETEVRTARRHDNRLLKRLGIYLQIVLTAGLDKLNLKLGAFDPKIYRRDVAANSDFRKFDDGLKMTVDVPADVLSRIEFLLSEAEEDRVCSFGIHRQKSALMTCMVATALQRDHVHFIDGASGGYAVAAANLKAKLSAAG